MDRSVNGPHLVRLLGEWRSPAPDYVALAGAIRLLVLDGRLPLRTRLPGERELAAAAGTSRTTTAAAYAALRDEGFLASRRGSGQLDPPARRPRGRDAAGRGGRRARSTSAARPPPRRRERSTARSRPRPPSCRATCPAPATTRSACPCCAPRSPRT